MLFQSMKLGCLVWICLVIIYKSVRTEQDRTVKVSHKGGLETNRKVIKNVYICKTHFACLKSSEGFQLLEICHQKGQKMYITWINGDIQVKRIIVILVGHQLHGY